MARWDDDGFDRRFDRDHEREPDGSRLADATAAIDRAHARLRGRLAVTIPLAQAAAQRHVTLWTAACPRCARLVAHPADRIGASTACLYCHARLRTGALAGHLTLFLESPDEDYPDLPQPDHDR